MIGQVALYDIDQVEEAKQTILANSDKLIAAANDAYPSIVKRGGGAREIRLEEKEISLFLPHSRHTRGHGS